MQTKAQILLENSARSVVSYLCRIFALFHIRIQQSLPTSEPWCTDHLSQNKLLWLYLELWKYIFSISNCQSFTVSWKKNYETNWQEKAFSVEYNWITDCSYCNSFLIRNMTVWLFNDYLYLQFPEFAIIIGTIFAVHFF